MSIFNRIVLKGLIENSTRTLVTIMGVILSAAMITGVATFAVSLQKYMVNGAAAKYGDWHVEFLDVDSSFLQERKCDDGVVSTAAFKNMGYARLDGGKNPNKPYLFIAGFNNESFDNLPVKILSGRLPENSSEILVPAHVDANGGVKISVGDKLSLNVGKRMRGNEILNQHDPYTSGGEQGEAQGQEQETLVSTSEKNYTVVGIYQRPAFEEYTAPGYTLITMSDGADAVDISDDTATTNVSEQSDNTGTEGVENIGAGNTADTKDVEHSENAEVGGNKSDNLSVFVTLKNPYKVHSYASDTAGNHDYVFNDDVLRFMGLSDDKIFNGILYSIGGILIVLIMMGSIFLIYNSFTISLNDRTRQFGILLSVGATEKQLRNSVLFEGICIGAVGIPFGVLIGLPSIKFVLSIVSKNFSNILYSTVPLTLTISIPAIAAAAVISMVTILISAYIPARKAVKIPVMECIRQTNEVKIESEHIKTSKFMERIYGFEGTLALKNFKRNKKRYRSIVLSLTLSVVLFVSASAFRTDLKQASDHTVVNNDYDICFYSKDISEDEMFNLYDDFKTADGIYGSSYQALTTYSTTVKTRDFSEGYRESSSYDFTGETIDMPVDIQFVEDSIYLDFIKELGLPLEEYTGQNSKMIAAAKVNAQKKNGAGASNNADGTDSKNNKNDANVSSGEGGSNNTNNTSNENDKDNKNEENSGKSKLVDMFTAPSMDFMITPKINDGADIKQGQSVNITFVDTIPVDNIPKQPSEITPYVFMIIAPYELKDKFEVSGVPMEMGLTFLSKNPSQSVKEMKNMIEGAGVTSEYTLCNLSEVFEQNRNIIFIVDLFTIVFVVMISLIAMANVFNTISTNIKLRRRELAMLRSVGMSDRDFNKMMRFECALYGLRTLLIGLPISGILSWLIYKGMFSGGAEIDFSFPWVSMGISVLGVFLIIFITMLYAVSKIKKENIIDALRDDMI